MLRRAALGCIITLLSSDEQQFFQVITAALLFALAAVAHFTVRPFVDDTLNFLEQVALLSHLAVCSLAVIFVPCACVRAAGGQGGSAAMTQD